MSANPLFLSEEEIFAIVHPLQQPAAIVRWFKKNGFGELKVRPNGMPLIARAYFDQVTAGIAQRAAEETAGSAQPNIQAFREKHGRQARMRLVSQKV